MALATVDQLKRDLGITDGTQDTYLTDVLNWVSAWIETYTGRKFGAGIAVAVTGEVYEYPPAKFWLKQASVTVTKVDVRHNRTDAWETLAVDAYDWRSTGGLYLGVPYSFVKVDYTYDAGTTVPKDIEFATIRLASQHYRDTSVTKEVIGDYEIAHREVTPTSDDLGILDAYRVRNI